MEKTKRSITPPYELICQWQLEWQLEPPSKRLGVEREDYMINRAAQWAADQELDACCDCLEKGLYIASRSAPELTSLLRDNRRPKPPTLTRIIYQVTGIHHGYPQFGPTSFGFYVKEDMAKLKVEELKADPTTNAHYYDFKYYPQELIE